MMAYRWTFVIAILASGSLWAQQDTVRVCIFTQQNVQGFADRDSERRAEAVRHASEWIRKKDKRTVSLVDSKDAADVLVEVVSVPNDDSATKTVSWWAGISTTKRTRGDVQVLARLSVGDYSTEIFTQDKKLRIAAQLVGQEVGKWVKANRAKLQTKR